MTSLTTVIHESLTPINNHLITGYTNHPIHRGIGLYSPNINMAENKWVDASANKNVVNISGAVKDVEHGLRFDGIDDYARVAPNSSVSTGYTEKMSIGCWFKTFWPRKSAYLISKFNSNSDASYELFYSSQTSYGGIRSRFFDDESGEGVSVNSDVDAYTGKWMHVVSTFGYQEGLINLYVNGSQINSGLLDCGLLAQTSSDLFIGQRGSSNSYRADASIDSIFVINDYAMSDDEVFGLYNRTKTFYGR